MRISKKRDGTGGTGDYRGTAGKATTVWRIYFNGKKTELLICYDRTMREWDLCTEQDHIAAASSVGALMRRLDILAAQFEGAR